MHESHAERGRRILRAFVWSFGVWTAFAFLMMAMSVAGLWDMRSRGLSVSYWRFAAYNLIYYYEWALVTPVLVYFGLRFPIDRRTWPLRLPLHLLASTAAAALFVMPRAVVKTYATLWIGYPPRLAKGDALYFLSLFFDNTYMVVQVLVASQVIVHYRAAREREVRAAHLEARLATSQLEALRAQLQPHFLFNTLHAIGTLMQRDVPGARRMLTLLSDLLRRSLDASGVQKTSLREELDFVSRYLEIERTRFADRLTVSIDVAPEALEALVPSFLLQPLVENAIRHGISRRSGPGRVTVKALREGATVQLEVRDTGPGLGVETAPPRGSGVGLSNTRARLLQLYDAAQRMEVANAAEGGCVVAIAIPFELPMAGHGPVVPRAAS